MQRNMITPEILAGAVGLLRPYFQSLTAETLIQKLRTEAQPKEKAEGFVTKKEFAKKRGCSEMTVHRLIHSGQIPSIRISKRLIRIPASALQLNLNEVI